MGDASLHLFALPCWDARGAEQTSANGVWQLTLKSPRVTSCLGLCTVVCQHPLH